MSNVKWLTFKVCNESINQKKFSGRCPPKCTNHMYSHWFRTEFMNRFLCKPTAHWLERNNIDSLLRTGVFRVAALILFNIKKTGADVAPAEFYHYVLRLSQNWQHLNCSGNFTHFHI